MVLDGKVQEENMIHNELGYSGTHKRSGSLRQRREKAALVTPCLFHLPLHPSCMLGYGAAVLEQLHDLEVFDFNAQLHVRQSQKLHTILDEMNQTQTVSDAFHLYPFYHATDACVDELYAEVPWEDFSLVYITPPTWFPTVPTESVLRLCRAIRQASAKTAMFFFGNSLGSWTDESELTRSGVQVRHLNHLNGTVPDMGPVQYDLLPTPEYRHRESYLCDLLPFMLKHGCSWGRCRFCSFCSGSNAGHVERSSQKAIEEVEALVDRYRPQAFVCRDHSLKGHNLIEFCNRFERLRMDWCGQSRADLTAKQIEAMAKSGCRLIYFGLESGSDRTLRSMNKGITSGQMSEFIKQLSANGILPAPSVVIGAPGEEKADFQETIQFLNDHARFLEVVNAYPFMTTPGSDFSSRHEEPHRDVTFRLLQFIRACEDLGLKVCLGEQSIEHFLYTWLRARTDEGFQRRRAWTWEGRSG